MGRRPQRDRARRHRETAARRVGAIALALGALAALPSAAAAHARLEGTVPRSGATLHRSPAQVLFRFDEPVETNFGAARVLDARGRRVDAGPGGRPAGNGAELAVPLRPSLPDGTYTASYRVISADGHPVAGGFVFTIGKPSAGPTATVAQLAGTGGAGPVTDIAFGTARGLAYLATALALGGLIFLVAVWLPGLRTVADAAPQWRAASVAFAARARRLLVAAVALGVVSGLLGIVLEGATAAGVSFWAALAPSTVREVLATRVGTVWGLRVLDWLALGAALSIVVRGGIPVLRPATVGAQGLAMGPPLGRRTLAGLALPAALLAIAPALAGHATTQHPVALLMPLDVGHVVAMSAWLGGLVMLLALLPAATRPLAAAERTRLLAAVLVRFSPIALTCVAVLLVTGVGQSVVHIRHLDALTSTAFGRAVLIKVALLVALIGLGAVNRQRVVPDLRRLAARGRGAGPAAHLLRRTVGAEVALLVVVLAVTSALVAYAPPHAMPAGPTGPVSQITRVGPIGMRVTVDPAIAGANELRLALMDRHGGHPFAASREIQVTASLPERHVGPLPVMLHRGRAGRYASMSLHLAPAGAWRLQITDRVSEFDQYTTTVRVPVR